MYMEIISVGISPFLYQVLCYPRYPLSTASNIGVHP
jgi:hypothetical protein